jgi:transposase
MRELANASLDGLDGAFAALYEAGDRAAAPVARQPVAVLYSIRSQRQLVERLEFDLLFRWFVGSAIDDPIFDASTFSKNRDRLLTSEIAPGFLFALLA